MSKTQPRRMQHLPGRAVVSQFFQSLILPLTVREITDERKTEVLKMNPDLVRAAGMEHRLSQGRPIQPFEHLPVRSSRPA